MLLLSSRQPASMSAEVSHILQQPTTGAKDWWQIVKHAVRTMQGADGVIIVIEKPYTDETNFRYDHAQGKTKGINFITDTVDQVSLPVTYRLVSKSESYIDKQGKPKRRSPVTKNDHFRAMLHNCVRNRIPFRYVLNDIWFASAENMCSVKRKLDKEFVMALKTNRKIALSLPDKHNGRYHRLDKLDLPEDTVTVIYRSNSPSPSICSVKPAQMARPLCAIW